jgi:UDP-N-acetylmuramate--alanine ligase
MSALARYFAAKGKSVYGYDKAETPLTKELAAEGIAVHYDDDIANLPEFLKTPTINNEVIIIYTPAIPKDNREFVHLNTTGYKLWKRSEILGWITAQAKTIAVAGTHGKTTTSTMIAHVLKSNGINCTAFLGGISKNYNTNLLLPGKNTGKEVMIVEADEYDRSFLTLFPDLAVITSLDADHLDIYGNHQAMIESYTAFAKQVKDSGNLIIKAGLKLNELIPNSATYSIDSAADYKAEAIRIENSNYVFNISNGNTIYTDVVLTWPGRHNVENAVAAFAICLKFGLSPEDIKSGIKSFEGVKRRFDYQLRNSNITFIDDYAHHPEELSAAIGSVKELYPGKKILGIFQPHLYTRTRDFADGFGKSLSLLDELILLDIYPARELPIPGVSSEIILEKVTIKEKIIASKIKLTNFILNSNADVVLTLGAGDIDQLVEPIREALARKFNLQVA